MSFVGVIDRIEDGNAYIIIENGMFEISVPIQLIRDTNYKQGDRVTVKIYKHGIDNEVSIS
ncbi:MAG: hypothetical protein GX066_06090 [Clostridiaceae bacterium]|nr:hypothetical protein [Clostridiaceae bacterium]